MLDIVDACSMLYRLEMEGKCDKIWKHPGIARVWVTMFITVEYFHIYTAELKYLFLVVYVFNEQL